MRDVRVQFRAALVVAGDPVRRQSCSAVVAVSRPEVVLAAAGRAAVHQLAAGHRNEAALVAFDDLDVADYELVVNGDAAERLQLV